MSEDRFIDLRPPQVGPSPSTAFRIFEGDWAYHVPVEGTKTGTMQVFVRQPRTIHLLKEYFPDHADLDVLELGPHEGEHTFHLNNLPVRHIYAIEGRPANFLKCLIVKNELGLSRARFAVGDFVQYMAANKTVWDIAYCCGVLYHMTDPAEVLRLLARTCRGMILNTAVFDLDQMKAADARTSDEQFPTNWLRDVSPDGREHKAASGTYIYHRREYHTSAHSEIMGHGNSHAGEANLVSAATLRQIITDVGGAILQWDDAPNPRSPNVVCVVKFEANHSHCPEPAASRAEQ